MNLEVVRKMMNEKKNDLPLQKLAVFTDVVRSDRSGGGEVKGVNERRGKKGHKRKVSMILIL